MAVWPMAALCVGLIVVFASCGDDGSQDVQSTATVVGVATTSAPTLGAVVASAAEDCAGLDEAEAFGGQVSSLGGLSGYTPDGGDEMQTYCTVQFVQPSSALADLGVSVDEVSCPAGAAVLLSFKRISPSEWAVEEDVSAALGNGHCLSFS